MSQIPLQRLTKASFDAFGDVIEIDDAAPVEINQGFARRFNHLASIDVATGGTMANVSLFEAKPRSQPIAIALMERHPFGSQLFMPLQDQPWLVVVCGDPHDLGSYRAFTASGRQGVNYARNVWHHPLLVLGGDQRFLVVDRLSADNLEEVWLDQPLSLLPA